MQLAETRPGAVYAILLLLAGTCLIACIGFYDSDLGGDERFLAASRDGDDLVIHLSDCASMTVNRARIYSHVGGRSLRSEDRVAELSLGSNSGEVGRTTLDWTDLGEEFAVDVSGTEYRALLRVDPEAVNALPKLLRFDEEMVQFGAFGTTCE